MAAYVIADIRINDPLEYENYRKLVHPSLKQYNGKVLTAVGAHSGGKCEVLEGIWRPEYLVIVEFESYEQAFKWYNSPEYTEARSVRKKCAETNMIVVERA